FFFQAEDGIRDKLVTGVQTCALPISPLAAMEIPRGGQEIPQTAIARAPPLSRTGADCLLSFTGVHRGGFGEEDRGDHGDPGSLQIGRASCRERVEVAGGGG